ncbi:hypothetical protein L1987_46054 [Smallanthus sonchifolius]|uniref:Uncharacterized protein n=1 Tax=Smallanthus sonchifolius TaxID=185202 RepID=A0ACB9FYE8_9ASTR|nr:hypothetical protein L1987_46054 [Smallanthus sonchifolius]
MAICSCVLSKYASASTILAREGVVAYRLELPYELSGIHPTFYVSHLRKCLPDDSAHVPLDDIEVDSSLNYIEEPVAIFDRKEKQLRNKVIQLVKTTLKSWHLHCADTQRGRRSWESRLTESRRVLALKVLTLLTQVLNKSSGDTQSATADTPGRHSSVAGDSIGRHSSVSGHTSGQHSSVAGDCLGQHYNVASYSLGRPSFKTIKSAS